MKLCRDCGERPCYPRRTRCARCLARHLAANAKPIPKLDQQNRKMLTLLRTSGMDFSESPQAMGKPSREKGLRAEREIVARHAEIAVHAERVPLSGQQKFRNSVDIDVYAFGKHNAPLVAEVKARASGEGFQILERWLGEGDLLFLRRDRAPPMIILPWRTYERLLKR